MTQREASQLAQQINEQYAGVHADTSSFPSVDDSDFVGIWIGDILVGCMGSMEQWKAFKTFAQIVATGLTPEQHKKWMLANLR